MASIVSGLLAVAELPLIRSLRARQGEIPDLIDRLESAIDAGEEIQPILALLLRQDDDKVSSVFMSRLLTLHGQRLRARQAYARHTRDPRASTDELLNQCVALGEHSKALGRAFAAYELYLVAAR